MTADCKDPARWDATIVGSPRWVTQISWSNDGGHTWGEAQYVAGTVTCDATSQVRWTMQDLQLLAPYGKDGISPFRTRLRIRHGLQYSDGQDLIGMGVYRVTDANRSLSNPALVNVSGSSFEHYMIAPWGAFDRTRQFVSQDAADLVAKLILEVLPDATIVWRGADGTQMVPALTTDQDRWSLIDGQADSQSVAGALGVAVYCDGDGAFIVSPRGTLEDPPVWTAVSKQNLIESVEQVSLEGLYNIVAAYGTDPSGAAIGPFTVADVDPFSITNANVPINQGGIGRSLYQYSNDMITNPRQGYTAAMAKLAQSRGLQQTITIDQLYNPRLRPDDVGTVDTPSGPQKGIFDTLTFDLQGAAITGTTLRTTSTRFAGTVATFVDLGDDEGGE